MKSGYFLNTLFISYTVQDDGRERIIVAPFWANIDLTNHGYVYYRQSTEADLLERARSEIHL